MDHWDIIAEFTRVDWIAGQTYLLALTSVRPLVDFEVLRSGKHLPAAGEGAGEGLLPGVDPDVVHQLVLGLEGPAFSCAAVPEAGVVGDLWSSYVFHRDMRHNFMH